MKKKRIKIFSNCKNKHENKKIQKKQGGVYKKRELFRTLLSVIDCASPRSLIPLRLVITILRVTIDRVAKLKS